MRLTVAVVAAVTLLAGVTTSCSDGRPAFCDDLARSADMSAMTKALDAQDLDKARSAAEDFDDLASGAPDDIRSDLQDLARAVSDVVELLRTERSAVPGAGGGDRGDAAAVEQDRDRLNERLEELSTTSSRVERWASRNCGLSLT